MRERVKPDRLQLRQFTEGADSKVIVTMTLLSAPSVNCLSCKRLVPWCLSHLGKGEKGIVKSGTLWKDGFDGFGRL